MQKPLAKLRIFIYDRAPVGHPAAAQCDLHAPRKGERALLFSQSFARLFSVLSGCICAGISGKRESCALCKSGASFPLFLSFNLVFGGIFRRTFTANISDLRVSFLCYVRDRSIVKSLNLLSLVLSFNLVFWGFSENLYGKRFRPAHSSSLLCPGPIHR